MPELKTYVVVGNGMVGHRFIQQMKQRGALENARIITFCEESRLAYDRVALTSYLDGKTADELSLVEPNFYDHPNLKVYLEDKVTQIDIANNKVTSQNGVEISYDKLILATGSYPFVPPVPGADREGAFVYRTLDDLDAISEYAKTCTTGAVVGGGLLGLEAANALKNLGLKTHVVEFAPRLMAVQLDEGGGSLLRNIIEDMDVSVHTSKATQSIDDQDNDNRVHAMNFVDDDILPVDMVVFSCGIRPRDQLAREAGLEVGPRGGITINNQCQTSHPDVYAIGECALWQNKIFGLVAPGYDMAETCAKTLLGEASEFQDADMSTKLKLMGVDVASFGDAHASTPGARSIIYADDTDAIYKKIVIDPEHKTLLGGILVGDASDYGILQQMVLNKTPLPQDPKSLILPASDGASGGLGVDMLPETAVICSCMNVTKADLMEAVQEQNVTTMAGIKQVTEAATGCGGCAALAQKVLNAELEKAGFEVDSAICEHFDYTRQELFEIVRSKQIKSFDDLLATHGSGLGCETCKPAVASILASNWNDHILDTSHAPLQDTNDRFLANIQKDGTYSVVPRIAGGEITPDKLIVLGQVAKQFNLYTKITGGQRVDLFGARLEQLPLIWEILIDAGFETGHAYGKSLRTVKSCVGSTWCRYGVDDSTSLAIEIENRYKGLRSPHKLKSAVSGCTRECAEAQSKDFGIIATDQGWNLYVCGNGGMVPQHAMLLAGDLDKKTLLQYIDRFLMFYVRTADKLQRTSTWINELEGGLGHLKEVVINDKLGICQELEEQMQSVVETYQCEWKTVVDNPEKRDTFTHFVNSTTSDDNVVFLNERDQIRPASEMERTQLTISGQEI